MGEMEILENLKKTRHGSRQLARFQDEQISAAICSVANLAERETAFLLAENRKDLDRMDPANPKYDRLLLNETRLAAIANDLRNVAALPSPLGKILEERTLSNGLHLQKKSVPLGVVGIIFESRPNVTFDVFSLCLKSGNASVLKGSRDAEFSNKAIVQLIRKVLSDFQLEDCVYLAPADRESLPVILNAVGLIDVAIPRGSQELINAVRQNARIPVIETGAGIVHTYIDKSCNPEMAKNVITNAKARRVSVCNALDTLIIHESQLNHLPYFVSDLGRNHHVKIFADHQAFSVLSGQYPAELIPASEADFGVEFLDYKMAIKTVGSLDEAIDHINSYSSFHSEAILTDDQEAADIFISAIDAAAVYVNTSTAFTDGAQFGMGAEIGISTQKLHARGPMALPELTTYKWIVRGNGHIRTP